MELEEEYPEKLHGPTKPTMGKSEARLEYLLDQDEINSLIEASVAPYVPQEPSEINLNYKTYTQVEVNALIAGDYDAAWNKKRK